MLCVRVQLFCFVSRYFTAIVFISHINSTEITFCLRHEIFKKCLTLFIIIFLALRFIRRNT